MLIDPAISTAFGYFLAALLFAAAAHKAITWREFVSVVENFRIIPNFLSRVAALAIVGSEAIIAACLLAPEMRDGAAASATALFSIYGFLIAFNILRGRTDIDCGCSFGPTADRITWLLVARNAMLVVSATIASMPTVSRDLGMLDAVTIIFGAVALGLIYLTAEALRANWLNFVAAGYR